MFDYEVENGILKIFLCGEVDHHHAVEIRTCVDELIDRFLPKTVILDFEHVSFCDSSGIAIVLGRYKKMKSLDSDLFLSGLSGQTLTIFQLANIEKIVKILQEEK